MRHATYPRRLFGLSILTLLCTASCSYPFLVRPAGRIDGAVTFDFFEAGGLRAATVSVYYLAVMERGQDKEWTTAWHVAGKQTLARITYADVPSGLKVLVPAKRLSATGKYRVIVSGRPGSNPAGHAIAYFAFDDNGVLVTTDPPG